MSDSGRCIGQERERQWDDRDTEIAELRSEVERLMARLAEVEAWKDREQQASIAIAAACLCAGCHGTDGGTVSAVRELAAAKEAAKQTISDLRAACETQEEELSQLREDLNIARACKPDEFTHVLAAERFAASRAEAAEKRVKELEDDLKWIATVTPIKGLYHGGETYAGLNQRIQQQAKKALERESALGGS